MRERPDEGETAVRESRGRTERRIKQLFFIVVRGESVGLRGGERLTSSGEGKPLIIKFLLNSNHLNSNSLYLL